MKNEITTQDPVYTKEIVKVLNETSIITNEDKKFLAENVEHFKDVMENTYMWRTMGQKRSIISDEYHPTNHSKFHQAILEMKVQFEQAHLLSIDFQKAQLDVEELELNLEESRARQMDMAKDDFPWKREDINQKRSEVDLKSKVADSYKFKTAMKYRMSEVKQWKVLQDDLMTKMLAMGMTTEEIWSKEAKEIEDQFYMFLSKMKGIQNSTDGAELQNLLALAKHGVQQAIEAGMFENLITKCDKDQMWALETLGYIRKDKAEEK